jgi:hypothetical protein
MATIWSSGLALSAWARNQNQRSWEAAEGLAVSKDVARDQEGINLTILELINKPLKESAMLEVPPDPVEGLAEVPVAGVKDAHRDVHGKPVAKLSRRRIDRVGIHPKDVTMVPLTRNILASRSTAFHPVTYVRFFFIDFSCDWLHQDGLHYPALSRVSARSKHENKTHSAAQNLVIRTPSLAQAPASPGGLASPSNQESLVIFCTFR